MALLSPCIALYRVQVPRWKDLPPLRIERGRDTLLVIRPHSDGGGVILRSNAQLDMLYLRGAENLAHYRVGRPYAIADRDSSSRLWNVSIFPEKHSGLLLINRDSLDARVTLERYSTGGAADFLVPLLGGIILGIVGVVAAVMLGSSSARRASR